MDLLIILTYAAFAYGAFRLFKIPVNGFSLLTAALGGIALLSVLLLGMNYNHPFSSQVRLFFHNSPIARAHSAIVIAFTAQSRVKLKKGEDVLRMHTEP